MENFTKLKLDNGLIRTDVRPHTKDIEKLTSCCSAQDTSAYYLIAKHFNENVEFEEILTEISKLQDTDTTSHTYGCLRWYREEPIIRDTNGAFFVLRHLAVAFRLYPHRISAKEQELIFPVFERSLVWFKKQCAEHGYFYPNKIMSDGGLLALIGAVTDNQRAIDDARDFWNDWICYTDTYGWGWGENTSKCYTVIMIDALNYALLGFSPNEDIYEKLLEKRNLLLNYAAFHGKYEYVPSIRSYNFTGAAENEHKEFNFFGLANKILTDSSPTYTPIAANERFHREHIFADSFASTFNGKNIRLGSINKFPVMPGCYQNEEWGLGWQSMPVSVLAKNHETSFLRFIAETDGRSHTHPARDQHSSYLFNRLFEGDNIPDCFTVSNQKDNAAVVVRGIYHIANNASYIADEWLLQRFDGEFSMYEDWFVFKYSDFVLAIKPLGNRPRLIRENGEIRIAQVCYSGTNTLVTKRKWISSWAVAVFDTTEDAENELDNLSTSYEVLQDLRYPRVIPPIKITCGDAELTFDPDFDI